MAKKTTGEIHGNTMRKTGAEYEGSSMVAASMIVFGTPCSAAMKMIIKKPAFFQMSMMMIDIMAVRLDVSQCNWSKAEPDQVVIDDAEIVAVEITAYDRDEGGGDDYRQEIGEAEQIEKE